MDWILDFYNYRVAVQYVPEFARGMSSTIWISGVSLVLSLAIGTVAAIMRISANPILWRISARGYMIEYPEFKILEGAPDKGPLSFATRPAETHLVRWMDNYLMLIEADGRMDKLKDYWMFGTDWKKERTPVPK